MKSVFPVILLLLFASTGSAQVTSLLEDFDISCASSSGPSYPTNWTGFCKFTPTSALQWNCTPLEGRYTTPGFECNSYYGGVHHEDTAWLFTPKLNLSGNLDHIYMRYDSKYEYTAAKLSILYSPNYIKNTAPDSIGVDWTDISGLSTPVVGINDSLDWVTHYIDLTPYKAIVPLIVAFKYTSTNFSGGRWTLDNIMTTPWGLSVKDLSREPLPITVLGAPTTEQINISCSFAIAGSYKLSVYDLLGREVHSEMIHPRSGTQNFSISELQLSKGMHFIKINNSETFGVAKVMVD